MTELFHGRQNLIICLCLAGAIAAVYQPVRHFEFTICDDDLYVTQNPDVQGGLTLQGVVWAFTTRHFDMWMPLTWLSCMLDCQLFGLNAGAHHQVNVLFHVVNTLLLFGVLRRMTAASWRSAFVAALFALHPLHVESVAWVAERKDVLSTCFWMLTMWAYVLYVEQPNATRYWLTFGLYALGLMAKPMVVTLPFVLLLLDYWPLGRTRWTESAIGDKGKALLSQLLWEKLPFLALAAASCVVTFWAQHAGGAVASLASLPIRVRVPSAAVSYLRYVEKMFWPSGLAAFYPYRIWSLGVVVGAVAVLASVSVIVIWRARRQPYLIVGWLWYLGTLAPVIGLVQAGTQSMADRYTYIPLAGLFIIAAWCLPRTLVAQRKPKMVIVTAAAALLVSCVVMTGFQVRHWKNSETLMRHTLDVTEGNWRAHLFLGLALEKQGKVSEAIRQYQQALRLKPDYAEAHDNLGVALSNQGKVSEAIAEFVAALRIKPDNAEACNNLGLALASQGKVSEAIYQYEQALRIRPDYAKAQNNIGLALASQGKASEAIAEFAAALRIQPDYAEAHCNLGVALVSQGRIAAAIVQYREALRLKPDLAPALYALAWILATHGDANLRNAGEAVQLAERLCATTGSQNAEDLDVLAAAYAEAGRFSDAIRVAQKAIELAGDAGQQELAQHVQERLKLYQAGQPFLEGSASAAPEQ
jgi:protein O-mannosyl-transferase